MTVAKRFYYFSCLMLLLLLVGTLSSHSKIVQLNFAYLGGFFILLTSLFSLVKRTSFFNKRKIREHLRFHMFVGFMGPILIIFHTNFKTRGIAGLSFWLMVIIVLTGAIGYYKIPIFRRSWRETHIALSFFLLFFAICHIISSLIFMTHAN